MERSMGKENLNFRMLAITKMNVFTGKLMDSITIHNDWPPLNGGG